jgi:hypothetical protein
VADPRGGQPSEEELRGYLQQLREADPGEVVAQAYTMLGTGAEVKLGRPDARTLIDAMAALTEAVAGRVPAELTKQMRDGVSRTQLAQVQTEGQQGQAQPGAGAQPAAGGQRPQAQPPRPSGVPGGQQGQPQAPGGRMTDRLWVPGRDRPPAR